LALSTLGESATGRERTGRASVNVVVVVVMDAASATHGVF